MVTRPFLLAATVAVLVLGCVGRHRSREVLPGTRDDLGHWVMSLEPLELGRRTRSGLLLHPDGREEFISVTRTQHQFEILVFFCPEAGESQERELVTFSGTDPDSGWCNGEVRCGHCRYFTFPSSTQAIDFLQKAFEVMDLPRYHYSTIYTTMREAS
jgi:hypothetical protein